MTLDQGRNVAVIRSWQKITFPMTRHHPIFNRVRSLADRDDVFDLPTGTAFLGCLFGATDRALRSKMANQLFLKHTAGLNE